MLRTVEVRGRRLERGPGLTDLPRGEVGHRDLAVGLADERDIFQPCGDVQYFQVVGVTSGQIPIEGRHRRLEAQRISEHEWVVQRPSQGHRLGDLLARLGRGGIDEQQRAGKHQTRPGFGISIPNLRRQLDGGPGIADRGGAVTGLHAKSGGDKQDLRLQLLVEPLDHANELAGVLVGVIPVVSL
ncbi:MAG TPA: hypothetical protein VHM29_05900, partial [Acidimicrobiia bacterium]|nr:hypothetical protein [Acidimicrobiia bacterium]